MYDAMPASLDEAREILRRTFGHAEFRGRQAEVIAEVRQKADHIRGVKIIKQPKFLRHFTCECAWV